jgi:iron complex transport system substrate-binding protein
LSGQGTPDWGRRAAIGACVAAPLAFGAALARGARAAMVGAGDFVDSDAPAGGFPKPLRGPTGAVRTLPRPPRRIVSTYLGADELLADLVDHGRVAAVSVYVDDAATSNCRGAFPADLPRLRSDPETIIALAPDLVCVAGFTEPDALRLIAGAGLPIVRWSRYDSFADVMGQILLMGAATGEGARAATLVARIEAELAMVETRLHGVRPRRVLYYDPPTYTLGPRTLVGEILTRAGAVNVVEEVGITGPGQLGVETILSLDPEAIVMPVYVDNVSSVNALAGAPIWRDVSAVRAGRVYQVPGAWIASVSHHAARGLVEIARLLHPGEMAGAADGPHTR